MSVIKRARFVLCASIALVSLAVAAGGANAAPPLAGSGTFTYQSSTFDSIRQAGGNTIIELSATVLYTGTFAGTSIRTSATSVETVACPRPGKCFSVGHTCPLSSPSANALASRATT